MKHTKITSMEILYGRQKEPTVIESQIHRINCDWTKWL